MSRDICLRCLATSQGGGERTRTADFYVANVALYQLSYTPGRELQVSPPAGGGSVGGAAQREERLDLLAGAGEEAQLHLALGGHTPEPDEQGNVDDEQHVDDRVQQQHGAETRDE